MNVVSFIKEYGIEKSKEVINGAPDETVTHFDLTIEGLFYFKFEKFDWFCFYDKHFVKVYMEDYESYHLTNLKEIKRLVESVDLVNLKGGVKKLKKEVDCLFHNDIDGVALLYEQAISDYELIYSDKNTTYGELI